MAVTVVKLGMRSMAWGVGKWVVWVVRSRSVGFCVVWRKKRARMGRAVSAVKPRRGLGSASWL